APGKLEALPPKPSSHQREHSDSVLAHQNRDFSRPRDENPRSRSKAGHLRAQRLPGGASCQRLRHRSGLHWLGSLLASDLGPVGKTPFSKPEKPPSACRRVLPQKVESLHQSALQKGHRAIVLCPPTRGFVLSLEFDECKC